jgi:asparagine synthetase B (glutamine-hydrolysing)
MSLTAFLVIVGTPPEGHMIEAADAPLDAFLTQLTEQPAYAHTLPGAKLWQSSIYPDESEVAVFQHSEAHPLDGRQHDRMIVFDGWIENREETVASLQHHGITAESSDSEIVLAGYREWGYDVAQQLYGEYSFVVLDYEEGQPSPLTFAVRDKVGIRPLFYSEWKGGVALSNFPGALSVIPWVGSEINEGYAAEYLCAEINSVRETLFLRVARLLGGHYLSFDRCFRTAPYWLPSSDLMKLTVTEASAGLRACLDSGTLAAARSNNCVGLLVSGGVDSSSIAAILSGHIRASRIGAPNVVGYSLVYPGLLCDESFYIDALEKAVAFPLIRESARYSSSDELFEFTNRLRYPMGTYVGTSFSALFDRFRAAGGRVMINGEGGDELLAPYASALWRAAAHPSEWHSLANFFRQRYDSRPTEMSFRGQVDFVIRPVFGDRLSNWLSRTRGRSRTGWKSPINVEWANRVQLSDRLDSLVPPGGCRTLACALSRSGFWADKRESMFFSYFVRGIEARSPLISARLLEYCNKLRLRFLDGQTHRSRLLLRMGVASELPNLIIARDTKAEFSVPVLPPLRAIAHREFGDDLTDGRLGGLGTVMFGSARTGEVWRLDAAQSMAKFLKSLGSPLTVTPDGCTP